MTKDILKEQKMRDQLKKIWITSGHAENSPQHLNYKTSRNKVVKMIRIARKTKSLKNCGKAHGDSEKMWKVVKEAADIKSKPNVSPDFIKITTADGNIKKIQNKKEIANEMNKRFCQMGAKLAEKLPSTDANFSDYLPTPNPNHERFILQPATETEVDKESQALDESKSIGVDEISPKIVKWSAALLTPILTKLINKCFLGGI